MVLQPDEPTSPQGAATDDWTTVLAENEGLSAAVQLVRQCQSCGNEFTEDTHFCRRCGTKRAEVNQLGQALDDDQKKAKDVVASFFDLSSQLEESDQRLSDEMEAHAQSKRKIKALETALVKKNSAHERDQQALAASRTRLQEEIEAHRLTREAFDGSQDAIVEFRSDIASLTQQLQEREAAIESSAAADRYRALFVEFEKLQDEFEVLSQKHDDVKSSFKSALFTVDAYRKEYHSVQSELEVSKRDLAKQREDLAKLLADSETLQEAKAWLEQMTRERARAALEKAQSSQDAAILRGFVFHWRSFVDQRHTSRLRKEQNLARVLRGDAAATQRLQKHGFLEWARLAQIERHTRRMEVRMKRALTAFTKQLLAEDSSLLQAAAVAWKDFVDCASAKRRRDEKHLSAASRMIGMGGNRLKSCCYRAWMQEVLEVRHAQKFKQSRCQVLATLEKHLNSQDSASIGAAYRAWTRFVEMASKARSQKAQTLERSLHMVTAFEASALRHCHGAWAQQACLARQTARAKEQSMASSLRSIADSEKATLALCYSSWVHLTKAACLARQKSLAKERSMASSLRSIADSEKATLALCYSSWVHLTKAACLARQKLRAKERSMASSLRSIADSEKATLALCSSSWVHLAKARRRRRAGHSSHQALKSAMAMDSILQVQCLSAWMCILERAKRAKVVVAPGGADSELTRLRDVHDSELQGLRDELHVVRQERDNAQSQLEDGRRRYDDMMSKSALSSSSDSEHLKRAREEITQLAREVEASKLREGQAKVDADRKYEDKIAALESDARKYQANVDRLELELDHVKRQKGIAEERFEQQLQRMSEEAEHTKKGMTEHMQAQHSEMMSQVASNEQRCVEVIRALKEREAILEETKKEIDSLMAELREARSERDDIMKQLELTEHRFAEAAHETQEREASLARVNDELRMEIGSLTAALEQSKQQNEANQNIKPPSFWEEQIRDKELELENNIGELTKVRAELAECNLQYNETTKQLEESAACQQQKCKLLEDAVQDRERQLEKVNADLVASSQQRDEIKRQLEEMKRDKDVAEERFAQTLHGIAETVEDTKKGMSELAQQRHSDMQKQVADVTLALKERDISLEETKKEVDRLNTELREIKTKRDDLMNQLAFAESSCAEAAQKAQDREAFLSKNNEELRKEVEALAADLEAQQRPESGADDIARSQRQQCKELREALRERDSQLARNHSEVARANTELMEMKRQCDELKAQFFAAERRCVEAEHALAAHREATERLESEGSSLEVRRLIAELEDMKRQKDLAEERFEQTLHGMADTVEDMKKGMSELMDQQHSDMKKQVTDAAQQCAEMTRALREREAALEETKREMDNLSKELQDTKSQRDKIARQMAMAEKSCAEIVQNAQERESNLARKNEELRQEVEGLVIDLEKMKQQHSENDTEEDTASQDKKCQVLADAIRERELQLKRNGEELMKASAELTESRRQCEEIKNKLALTEQRCAETEQALKTQAVDFRRNSMALSTDSNTLAALRDDLRLKCLELEGAKKSQTEIQRLTAELEEVRRQKDLADERFEQTLQGMAEDAEHMKKGMTEQLQAHSSEMKRQVADAAQQCAEMTRALQERETMLKETRKQIDSLTNALRETQSQRDDIMKQFTIAENKCAETVETAQAREAHLAQENGTLRREVAGLVADLETAKHEKPESHTNENAACQQQRCDELAKAIREREVKLDKNNDELAKASAELLESRRQCDEIKSQLMEAEQRCIETEQALQSQETNWKKNNLSLTSDANTLASLREDLHSKCLQLDGATHHQAEIQRLHAELDEIKRQKDLADERFEETLKGMAEAEDKKNGISDQMQEQCVELKKQVADAAQQCAEMTRALRDREVMLEQTRRDVASLSAELQLTRSQRDDMISQLQIAEQKCLDIEQRAHEREANLSSSSDELRKEVEGLAAERDTVRQQFENRNGDVTYQAQKCEELSDAIRVRELQLERNTEELEKLSAELVETRRQCDVINKQLKAAEQRCAETEQALSSQEVELKKNTLSLTNDSNTLATLREDLHSRCLELDGAKKNAMENERLIAELEMADERLEMLLQGMAEEVVGNGSELSELLEEQQADLKKQVVDSAQQCAEMARTFKHHAADVEGTKKGIHNLRSELDAARSHQEHITNQLAVVEEKALDSNQTAQGCEDSIARIGDSSHKQPELADELRKQLQAAEKKCSEIGRAIKSQESMLKRQTMAMTSDSNVLQKLQDDLRAGCLEFSGIMKVRAEMQNVLAELQEASLQKDLAEERVQQILLGIVEGSTQDQGRADVTEDIHSDLKKQVLEAAQQCAEVSRTCQERGVAVRQIKEDVDRLQADLAESKSRRDSIANELSDAEKKQSESTDQSSDRDHNSIPPLEEGKSQCDETKRRLMAAERKCTDGARALQLREADLKKSNLGLARESSTLAALQDDLRLKCLELDGVTRRDAELASLTTELQDARSTLDELRAEVANVQQQLSGIKEELQLKEKEHAQTCVQEAEKFDRLASDLAGIKSHRNDLQSELDRIRSDSEQVRRERDEVQAQLALLESATKSTTEGSAEFERIRATVNKLTKELEEARQHNSDRESHLITCQRELEDAKAELKEAAAGSHTVNEKSLKHELAVHQQKFDEVVKALEAHSEHMRKQCCLPDDIQQDEEIPEERNAELKHEFELIAQKCAESALRLIKQESAELNSRHDEDQIALELKVAKSGRDKLASELDISRRRGKDLKENRATLLQEKVEIGNDLSNFKQQMEDLDRAVEPCEKQQSKAELTKAVCIVESRLHNIDDELEKINAELGEVKDKPADDRPDLENSLAASEEQCDKLSGALDAQQSDRRRRSAHTLDCKTELAAFRNELLLKCIELSQPANGVQGFIADLKDKLAQAVHLQEQTRSRFEDLQTDAEKRYKLAAHRRIMKVAPQLAFLQDERCREWCFLSWAKIIKASQLAGIDEKNLLLEKALREVQGLCVELAVLRKEHHDTTMRRRESELRTEQMSRSLENREGQISEITRQLQEANMKIRELVKSRNMDIALGYIAEHTDYLQAQCFISWVCAKHPDNHSAEWLCTWMNRRRRRFTRPDSNVARYTNAPSRGPRALDNHILRASNRASTFARTSSSMSVTSTSMPRRPTIGTNLPALASTPRSPRTPTNGLSFSGNPRGSL